ncbi:hypothetical protein ACVW0C_000477 [Thermostichus sp. OS-CIW-26]
MRYLSLLTEVVAALPFCATLILESLRAPSEWRGRSSVAEQ